MAPRRCLNRPEICSVPATKVTLVRRTPSIWPRSPALAHLVRLRQVPDAQQPAAHPRLHRVARVATRRLLRLRQQYLFVPNEDGSERFEVIGDSAELIGPDDRRIASNLDNSPMQGDLTVERGGSVGHSVA